MPTPKPTSIYLTEDELARLDELRPPKVSRTEFFRRMLRRAEPETEGPSHGEAIMLLAQSARSGHVQAQIALERALRASLKQEDEVGDAIAKLLAAD